MQEDPKVKKTAGMLVLLAMATFGFGFAMVPLYDIICEVTGLNGKTGRVEAASVYSPDLEREIRVQFSATVNNNASWAFEPDAPSMVVHPGKPYTVSYTATNLQKQAATAQASPSVAPTAAGPYFNKTECFCFTEQNFAGLEQKQMPVTFVIDPAIPPGVDVVTLSYTFFKKNLDS